MKKVNILGLVLLMVVILLTALVTPASVYDECPAAPAVAGVLLEEAGIDVGSLDVFLNNGDPEDRRLFSPLDNPGRPPDGDNVKDGDDIANENAAGDGLVMYLAYETSAVDLLI